MSDFDGLSQAALDQIKEMAASGLVEIGSHTANHPDLRLKKEAESRAATESQEKEMYEKLKNKFERG